MSNTVTKMSQSNTPVMETLFYKGQCSHTHRETCISVRVCDKSDIGGSLQGDRARELCASLLLEVLQIKNSPPPGGKTKLSGVRGCRQGGGHTRVRPLFTTAEAHIRPPTHALLQYCTSAGGALHHDPLGGSKASFTSKP